MSREAELLVQIRDLLLLLAEPALAKRDQKLRDALQKIVGTSSRKRAAVSLMNGSKSQAAIAKEAKIDPGQLSKLVKALANESLIASDEKHPKLMATIPPDFLEEANQRV